MHVVPMQTSMLSHPSQYVSGTAQIQIDCEHRYLYFPKLPFLKPTLDAYRGNNDKYTPKRKGGLYCYFYNCHNSCLFEIIPSQGLLHEITFSYTLWAD